MHRRRLPPPQKGDAFCTAAAAANAHGNATDQAATPAELKAEFKAIINSVLAVQKRAPKDAEALVSAAVNQIGKFEAILAKYHYDLAAMGASADGAALLGDESNQKPIRELDAYLQDKCGIDPNTQRTWPADRELPRLTGAWSWQQRVVAAARRGSSASWQQRVGTHRRHASASGPG